MRGSLADEWGAGTCTGENADLDILHQIVKDTKTLWVIRLRDIKQRSQCRGLHIKASSSYFTLANYVMNAYLEGDVLITKTNLQLLLPSNVLLRPVSIVFPVPS